MSQKVPDHYNVLGISPQASFAEIKKRYQHLVLALHPDRTASTHSTPEFVKVQAAWEVLREEQSRKQYDQLLLRMSTLFIFLILLM